MVGYMEGKGLAKGSSIHVEASYKLSRSQEQPGLTGDPDLPPMSRMSL